MPEFCLVRPDFRGLNNKPQSSAAICFKSVRLEIVAGDTALDRLSYVMADTSPLLSHDTAVCITKGQTGLSRSRFRIQRRSRRVWMDGRPTAVGPPGKWQISATGYRWDRLRNRSTLTSTKVPRRADDNDREVITVGAMGNSTASELSQASVLVGYSTPYLTRINCLTWH